MSNKKIIPRKDHEVYFILLPKDIKTNAVQKFVFNALSELHPAFSSTTCVDIQTLIIKDSCWLMVTVIESETLSEYQFMWRGAILYTNTSILAHKKDFISNAPRIIDDELIGFNAEENKPISIPLDTVNTAADSSLLENIKHIPTRHGVFVKKTPKWFIVMFLAVIFMLISMPLINFIYNKKVLQPKITITKYDEQETEIIYMPSAITILAKISEYFVQANGEIQQWQYNENNDPCIILQCKGISVFSAHEIFDQLEYLNLQDIQDVRYIDDIPWLTITAKLNNNFYSLPVFSQFLMQGTMLAINAELTESLQSQNLIIVSETLPSVGNNYSLYTITYTAKDQNLVRSMEIIEHMCESYSLRVNSLFISTGSNKSIFTITCSLSSIVSQNGFESKLTVEKEKIPVAFGYKPVRQPVVNVQSQQKTRETPVIGTIKDFSGETVYFHNTEGKIQVRSNR